MTDDALGPRLTFYDAATLDAIAEFYGAAPYKMIWSPPCGEAAAAVGTLVLPGGVAGLHGGATLPGCRGKGIQQALIRRRWRDAAAAGARLLFAAASPDSTSLRNLQRQGLEPAVESVHYGWTP